MVLFAIPVLFERDASIGPTCSKQTNSHVNSRRIFLFEPGELGFSVTKAAKGCNLGWLQRAFFWSDDLYFHMKMPG